ncbi:MAG: SDR family oxidoreductase [Pseudolabrys sp.]|nr:SDR family oxidoreductase [Pseudolabrys sp.]
MDLGLKGKVALITGGSSGIGLAAAERFLAEGARVVVTGRDKKKLQSAAAALRENAPAEDVAVVVGDVAKPADVQAMVTAAVDNLGRLDIVVSNAGSRLPGNIDTLAVSAFETYWRTKVMGSWELARQAAPHLRRQSSGRFIVVIGQEGKVPAADTIGACVTEAAQHAFVKALSDHFAKDNVLVNAVCPGRIVTPMTEGLNLEGERYLGQSLEHQESGWGLKVPLGRMGAPEDVANAIAFLASERASFLCGTNFDVDGGYQRMIF